MQETTNYGLKKPAANEFYDVQIQNDNMDVIDNKMKEIESAADPSTLQNHIVNKSNPHGVTKSQIGLSNVPNVSTNNQTPTYAIPSTLNALASGEKLSVAMGKIAKTVAAVIQQQTDIKNLSENVTAISYTKVTGTLAVGETSITLTSGAIASDSAFDIYTSIYGVNPTAVTASSGSITLEFDAQSADMAVEVRVS